MQLPGYPGGLLFGPSTTIHHPGGISAGGRLEIKARKINSRGPVIDFRAPEIDFRASRAGGPPGSPGVVLPGDAPASAHRHLERSGRHRLHPVHETHPQHQLVVEEQWSGRRRMRKSLIARKFSDSLRTPTPGNPRDPQGSPGGRDGLTWPNGPPGSPMQFENLLSPGRTRPGRPVRACPGRGGGGIWGDMGGTCSGCCSWPPTLSQNGV